MKLPTKFLVATAISFGLCTHVVAQVEGLPAEQQQGNVRYRSGGIGIDESTAFKTAIAQHSATLVFTSRGGGTNTYLADVPVTVLDSRGRTVLQAAVGPYLLLDLPDGKYTARAQHEGETLTRTFEVAGKKGVRVAFDWPA